jgi:hypothetical protein
MAASKKPAKTNQSSVKRQKEATAGLESAFATRTAGLEETDALYERANKKLQAQLATQNLINASLKEANNLSKAQKKGVETLTKMWGEFESLQAKYKRDVKDGLMTQEQANKKLKEHRVGYDRLLQSTKLNGKENAELVKVLKSMGSEMKSVGDAFDKTEKKAQLLNAAMDQFGSSNIPMMREFSQVLQGIASKDLAAVRMALTAAGAAAAVLAKSYLFPEMKASQDVENEVKQIKTDNIADIAKIENKRGFVIAKKELERSKNRIETENTVNTLINDANFASQRAAIQFSAQLQTGAAEFKAAAKTALYGKGIGSIGYGAAQMQLAGIGAENVAASLTTATKTLGTKVSSDFAADMSVLEKRTGQSSENVSNMVSFFRRMGKLTNESALNMTEGMRAMAESAGIDLGGYMEEVAQASKEALGYQIKSGPALQKQVAYAQQLGVSFGDIAKAGKSMVLNYKDSIKSEMSLSAMLGRNVNLSEARALFAQGKTDEALKSIKAQGLDPKAMNMFQQEALSQALGGLDLDTIQKIATGSATDVSAQTGNVKAGNKGFLKTTQSAQSTLASQTASISANTAVIDAQLSGKITDAYLNSKEYKKYQASLITLEKQQTSLNQKEELAFKRSGDYLTQLISTAKNNIENLFSKDNFKTLGVGLAGALAGNVLGKGIEKLVGGIQKVFVVNSGIDLPNKKNKKTPAKTPAKTSAKSTAKTSAKSTAKSATKQAEKSVVKQTEKQVAKQAAKQAAKQGGKSAAKALGKTLLKKIPFVGLAASLLFAGQRAMAGDFAGAGLEVASGGASIIPGFGTAASVGIDAALAARDMGAFDSVNPQATIKNGKVVPKTVVAKAATPASAAKPSQVLSDVQYQTRLQMKMVELLGVSSTLLQYILIETDKDKSINLNGVRLNQSLMKNLRTQMAVGRRETIGAPTGM